MTTTQKIANYLQQLYLGSNYTIPDFKNTIVATEMISLKKMSPLIQNS